MRPAAGLSPTVADPTSTTAGSCLVVVGGYSMPLPPGGSRWWPTSVLGVLADDSSMGMWSVAASSFVDDEVDPCFYSDYLVLEEAARSCALSCHRVT
jgi:hypothetical protein